MHRTVLYLALNWLSLTVVFTCVMCQSCLSAEPVAEENENLHDVGNVAKHLASPTFSDRHAAQQELIEIAQTEPEVLVELAIDAHPEVVLRLLKALEFCFLKNPDALGDRAEIALMKLSEEPAPVGVLARKTLLNHARIRETRARVALEKLGAEFSYAHPYHIEPRSILVQRLASAAGTGVGFGEPAILRSIWLHEDWSGKTEDLWHIRRLIHCPDIGIYSIKGNGMDLESLYRLASVIPGLEVSERGPCLGIKSEPFGGYRCVIGDVLPNSSADLAGLLRGDLIFELDGKEIRSFPHLVESLQVYKYGDVITMSIYRGRERMEVPVKLGSWRGVSAGSSDFTRAPLPFGGPLSKPIWQSSPPPVPLPEIGIQNPL